MRLTPRRCSNHIGANDHFAEETDLIYQKEKEFGYGI